MNYDEIKQAAFEDELQKMAGLFGRHLTDEEKKQMRSELKENFNAHKAENAAARKGNNLRVFGPAAGGAIAGGLIGAKMRAPIVGAILGGAAGELLGNIDPKTRDINKKLGGIYENLESDQRDITYKYRHPEWVKKAALAILDSIEK